MEKQISLTPETDAECGGPISGDDTWPSCYVTSDFARKLERERDLARATCEELVVDSNAVTLARTVVTLERERNDAREALEAVRNERDNTWEQLEAAREAIKEAEPNFSQAMRQWRMYADMHNDESLEKSEHMESKFFKQAAAALVKLKQFLP